MALGATVPVVIRLTHADLKLLDTLASRLHAARPGTVAIALRHMASTIDRDQPVYLKGPGAGLTALTTPPPAMGAMLAGNKATVRARLKSRERVLNTPR
jgi:hypothetical protein